MPQPPNNNPWSHWTSRYSPGTYAHPDAPDGGTGAGYSRLAGPSGTCLADVGVADPHSPEGNEITPAQAQAGYARYEFTKAKDAVRDAKTWSKLRVVAERVLGARSFGLGVGCGIVKNPAMSAAQLVRLQKIFIEADIYERLTQRTSSWKQLLMGMTLSNPTVVLIMSHLVRTGKLTIEDLKRSYEMREALIKEVGDIFARPLDFFARAKDQLKSSSTEKWECFCKLRAQTDLKSQFEAGEIFGDVLMEVAMLILAVISVGGAAAKLAAKIPQLVRVAEFVKGLCAAEAGVGVVAEAGEAAEDAKVAARAAEALPKAKVNPSATSPASAVPVAVSDLAKAPGSLPIQRSARLQIIEDFYDRTPGLGKARCKQDIRGIDLNEPVEVIKIPPPDTMTQYMREGSGKAGNFFNPVGSQSAESMGISGQGRIAKTFEAVEGEGLRSTAAPILDDWTASTNPILCSGGGQQVVVGDTVKAAFISKP